MSVPVVELGAWGWLPHCHICTNVSRFIVPPFFTSHTMKGQGNNYCNNFLHLKDMSQGIFHYFHYCFIVTRMISGCALAPLCIVQYLARGYIKQQWTGLRHVQSSRAHPFVSEWQPCKYEDVAQVQKALHRCIRPWCPKHTLHALTLLQWPQWLWHHNLNLRLYQVPCQNSSRGALQDSGHQAPHSIRDSSNWATGSSAKRRLAPHSIVPILLYRPYPWFICSSRESTTAGSTACIHLPQSLSHVMWKNKKWHFSLTLKSYSVTILP